MAAIRLQVLQFARDVRDSYWFLPGVIAALCVALGLGLVFVDAFIGDQWLGRFEWFYGSRPEGARAMLSTIAGSTITVAGVVFSITLAAVTYASGRFGPRLLGNFTRDRGNQATLGVFIGTYLYCLVVLRTIRSAQETSADTGGAVRDAFVPQVAMFGGLALGILSTGVLIYFVHHVTAGIHINTVIARVGEALLADVRELREAGGDEVGDGADTGRLEVVIAADRAGYIEVIDDDALVATAARHDLVLRVMPRPGDFVARGHPLVAVTPDDAATDAVRDAVLAAFGLGRQRSAQQDPRFAIDELVEIAALALSPGVNDPFTAIGCIDWLGAALIELGQCEVPRTWLRDDDGVARVRVNPLHFEDYLNAAFGQMRRYVAADPNARRSALATLDAVARGLPNARNRALVEAERGRLEREGETR